jgi:hypothetical protein
MGASDSLDTPDASDASVASGGLDALVALGFIEPSRLALALGGCAMSADKFISRLDSVRKSGPDKWQARCPAHADKGPSLAIRELDDGRVLLHCFAGCSTGEVLQAVGLNFSDLYPTNSSFHLPMPRKAFSARDALMGLTFEVLVLLQMAKLMAGGMALSDVERSRLLLSAVRIQRAQEVAL